MPNMNGYEATKAIRNTVGRTDGKTIPIIAMTANAFEEDRVAALKAGMNDHLFGERFLSRVNLQSFL